MDTPDPPDQTPGQRRLAKANEIRLRRAEERMATRLRERGWTVIPPRVPSHDTKPPGYKPYGERKPYTVADTLDTLTGPTSGVVTLPHHLNWSGTPVYNLDTPGRLAEMYEAVLSEASKQDDLNQWLDRDTLIRVWPDLGIPRRVRDLWQQRFPHLAPTDPSEETHPWTSSMNDSPASASPQDSPTDLP